jgi:starch-binding outer membrane protein, SusD/RagB family
MRNYIKAGLSLALVAVVGLTTACEDQLQTRTPTEIPLDLVDPVENASTFSNSAWQNYVQGFSTFALYGAWFTNEMRVGDTFPTRNEFGRRLIDDRNGTMNGELWTPLTRAVASSEDGMVLLEELEPTNINIVRMQLTSAFAGLTMAEHFCTGVIRRGPEAPAPELSTELMLEHAIERFQQVIQNSPDADMATAARVGLARANLFAGNYGQVAADDGNVPDGFVFNAVYVDQVGERTRLGNTVFAFSGRLANRESGVVGPEWRELGQGVDDTPDAPFADQEDGDPRVSWLFDGKTAQDGVHEYVYQTTHDGWDAPLPVASRLELDYLIAQAAWALENNAPALALIAERRDAAGEPPFLGVSDEEILEELLYQKGLDFWMTGRRMADWRWSRDHIGTDAGAIRFIIGPDDEYYKPEVGAMSDQTCFPLPYNEHSRNPDITR